MVVALVGGVLPAGVAVVGGFLLANWFFTPPFHRFVDHRRRQRRRPRRLRRRGRDRRRARRPGRAQPVALRPPAGGGRGARRAGRLAGPSRVGRRHARPAALDVRVPCRRAAPPVERRAGTCSWHRARSRRRGPRTPTSAGTSGAASPSRSPAVSSSGDDERVLNAFARPAGGGAQRARAPAGRGGARRRPRRHQHAAGRAAAGGVARPAHAAGVDQGVDLQPAPARHRVAARRRRRVPVDDRGGDRPPQPTSSPTSST